MRVLVVNAGSSTLKASLVEDETDATDGSVTVDWLAADDDADRVSAVLQEALARTDAADAADAVGYRVVHGGSRYTGPSRVDDPLLDEVERLDRLAPLHNRRAALVMRAAVDRLPDLPHVACFDTAFHATLPEAAWRYALPADWVEAHGIRRFGFHGLSVAWSVRRAAELLGRSVSELAIVVAHLGSGSSVTAVDGGRSAWTSMGYTPSEGLVMGTRSGSVDPGILVELVRSGVDVEALAEGLAERSGLLALGGTPSAQELQAAAEAGDARARLALDIYARSAAMAIAGAATALPRLDALVFTAGIGEHSAAIRGAIVGRLGALGFGADLRDADGDAVIAGGRPAVLVVEAREDVVIASEVAALLARPS
ncbi:MAG TPA: acetate/propionate family kinase [Candidatus Limnocylindria bacterium]|nr:acetate/propionate family kinase [Candidatus Limnocylindria bacterium]